VIDLVVKHENGINSPIFNESLLIKAPGSNQKPRQQVVAGHSGKRATQQDGQ
jgi:hypothetical protein